MLPMELVQWLQCKGHRNGDIAKAAGLKNDHPIPRWADGSDTPRHDNYWRLVRWVERLDCPPDAGSQKLLVGWFKQKMKNHS